MIKFGASIDGGIMKKSLLFTLMLVVFLDIGNFFMPMPVYAPLFLHSTLLQSYPMEMKSIMLGALLACYGFAQLFGAPIFGEFSDRHGRKKAILFSLGSATIGCLLAGIALYVGSTPLIFLSRLLVGFSSGTIAVVFAIVADNSTEKNKAKNLGYINVGISIGAAVGPIIGGYLVNVHSNSLHAFATPFYFMAFLYLLNMFFLTKLLSADQPLRSSDKRINFFTVFRNIYVLMSRSRYLSFMILTALCFQIGTEAFYLGAPIIAVNKFHMKSPDIGDYFMILAIVSAFVSSYLNAKVNSYVKNSHFIYLTCIFLYCTTMASFIGVNSKFIFLLPFLGVGLFGVMAWIQVNNLFSQAVDKKEQGLVFGVSQSMWSIGGIIGTLLVGLSSARLC